MVFRIIGENNLTGFVRNLLLHVIKDDLEKRKHLAVLLKEIFLSCIEEHPDDSTAQIIKLLENESLKSIEIMERMTDEDLDFDDDCLDIDHIDPEYDLGTRIVVFLLHKLGLDKEWKLILTVREDFDSLNDRVGDVYLDLLLTNDCKTG